MSNYLKKSGAMGQIRLRFKQEKLIIITIEDKDITKVLNGYDISQLIEDKIDQLYTTN